VDLDQEAEDRGIANTLKRDSFRVQHAMSEQIEQTLRAIERAAGVRPQEAGSVPVAVYAAAGPAGDRSGAAGSKTRAASSQCAVMAAVPAPADTGQGRCHPRLPSLETEPAGEPDLVRARLPERAGNRNPLDADGLPYLSEALHQPFSLGSRSAGVLRIAADLPRPWPSQNR